MLDPMEIPTKYMVRTTNSMLVNGFIGASMIGNCKGENGTEYAFVTGLVTEKQLKEKLGAADSFIRMLPEA